MTETPNILIVGSEASIRHLVCDSLAGGSFRCTGVQGAREAFEVVKKAAIDAALLDVSSMGTQDGLRLMRRLRDEAQDLPLVLVNGSPSDEFSLEVMRTGVVDYLMKPFSGSELVSALDRAVRWRRAAVRSRRSAERDEWRMARRTARLCQFSAALPPSDAALEDWLSRLYRVDIRTRDHGRRVAHLSRLVAGCLRVPAVTTDIIARAALLHDIGKLAIPRHIVRKTGPLTAHERRLVQEHVQSGYAIALASPFLEPSADILLSIRERFDGSGYPRQLRGEDIPLGARIVSVVEVLDALTSARSLVDPVSHGVANAELVRAAGGRFDPDVVSAWLRCADGLTENKCGGEGEPA